MRFLPAILLLAGCACACTHATRPPALQPSQKPSLSGGGRGLARQPSVQESTPRPAGTVIQPAASDLQVFGHGPEARALVEHYPQENAAGFQFLFRRGICLGGGTMTCRGGGDDGATCSSNADCASGPLTFTSGETEYFDAYGNSLGVQAFTAAEFDEASGLDVTGICHADNTIACASPGSTDSDACGSTGDDTCDNRPAAGYVPDHASYLVRNPKETVAHNVVPASAEMRICFQEFNDGPDCDPLIIQQDFEEYLVPAGQTYIYPLGNPDEAGGKIRVGVGHEPKTHHRGVNNQRHAYDIGVVVGNAGGVSSTCQSGHCAGGARDGNPCSANKDCNDNQNAYIYDEPIYAMADGTVVAILHDFPENPNPPDKLPGMNDCDVRACGIAAECDAGELPTTGNSVFIEYGNGEISHYAHTIPGTNNHLDCGDTVSQGERVANVGNSGNSTGPHLHYGTDLLDDFWDNDNYSFPSYVTNVLFAAGPDPTVRRQLDVSFHTGTEFSVTSGPAPLPANAPVGPGDVAESEPNDTLAGHDALAYPVHVDATLESGNVGDLAVRGDGIEDVYRIDLSNPDQLRVALGWGDGGKNLDVYLLTEDLRVLNETGQGTQRSGTEEAVCPALDAGAYYVMVTNYDPTKSSDEAYTLDVASDPQTVSAAVTNATQPVEVDEDCQATIAFKITLHDNCCLDKDTYDLQVDADNTTSNLTLGSVELDAPNVLGPRDIEITGRVDVSAVTSCPATVVISAQAKDCSGNLVTTTAQGTDASVDVVDVLAPQVAENKSDLYCLWPPQHRMVCFEESSFAPSITDNCTPSPTWLFAACTSDQPDDAPDTGDVNGDGHTVHDCVLGQDADDVCARAERAGTDEEGRRYTLEIQATDVCGNVSGPTAIGRLAVPHRKGAGQVCMSALSNPVDHRAEGTRGHPQRANPGRPSLERKD